MNDVTHLGIYDIPMMSNIPKLVYLAPTTKEEYLAMLDWSVEQNEHPVAIRIPCCEYVSTGEKIARFYGDSDVKVLNFGLKKEFLDRYDPMEILKENRLTKEQIVDDVLNLK